MKRYIPFILCSAVVILLIGLACGGDDSLSPGVMEIVKAGESKPSFVAYYSVVVLDPEEPVVAARVVLLPPEVTVNPGQMVIVNSVAYDVAGLPVSGVQLQWRMRDPNAGSVNNNGVFVGGLNPGIYPRALEVVVTQEVNGETVTLITQATVNIAEGLGPRFLSSVGVYPSTVNVRPAQFIGLGVLGWDGQGRFIIGLKFEWSMENRQAGSIDKFGFFTAGATLGDYPNAIRVRAIHTTSQGTIIVRENFVSVIIKEGAASGVVGSVEIIPKAVFLEPGDEIQFSVHAFDGNSQPVRVVDFLWSVENHLIGKMNQLGELTAGGAFGHYPGAVRVVAIQVVLEGEITVESSADVTVIQPEAQRKLAFVSIVPSSVSLHSGQRFLFTAIAFDKDGAAAPGVSYSWEVVDPQVGSIDRLGVFTTGDMAGTFPDAVRIKADQGEREERRVVISYASEGIIGDLEEVTIRPVPIIVRPGQSLFLQVTGHDANGLPVAPLRSTWSMENPRAGSIDSAGMFTAGEQPGEYIDAIKVVVTEP